MIKLFSLKQQKKDGEQNKGTQKKSSAAQLRIQKGKIFLEYFPINPFYLTNKQWPICYRY